MRNDIWAVGYFIHPELLQPFSELLLLQIFTDIYRYLVFTDIIFGIYLLI